MSDRQTDPNAHRIWGSRRVARAMHALAVVQRLGDGLPVERTLDVAVDETSLQNRKWSKPGIMGIKRKGNGAKSSSAVSIIYQVPLDVADLDIPAV